jgi:hypothetical protein
MRALQFVLAVLALGFAGLIVYAIADGSFSQAGAWLISQPWGQVTLADLYLGFVLGAGHLVVRAAAGGGPFLDSADPVSRKCLDRDLVHPPFAALARTAGAPLKCFRPVALM